MLHVAHNPQGTADQDTNDDTRKHQDGEVPAGLLFATHVEKEEQLHKNLQYGADDNEMYLDKKKRCHGEQKR